MIAAFYKIPIGNVTKLMLNFFDNGKYVRHYENFQLYLRLGCQIWHVKENRSREEWWERWKSVVQINEQW